jgi:hypothetical protein
MIIASSPGGWREYNDLVIREFSHLTQYQFAPHQQNSATSKLALRACMRGVLGKMAATPFHNLACAS